MPVVGVVRGCWEGAGSAEKGRRRDTYSDTEAAEADSFKANNNSNRLFSFPCSRCICKRLTLEAKWHVKQVSRVDGWCTCRSIAFNSPVDGVFWLGGNGTSCVC